MIKNPILKGFCPDPSIIRANGMYYIAVSTFEWWPGVKLFQSEDMENWEQIASPLRRERQMDLRGVPTSGGIWAPCLSFDGTYFYLVYTIVWTKKGRYYNTHNYMVWTDDIYGEWSDPVYLNSIGFDPSLFHDTDGRKYLVNMVNGFKGVLVQELEYRQTPEGFTWNLTGEQKKVYSGSGIGCTEGPHIYHIGDWYYLITAEGGTGYEHCVTLARAKSVWGPFETDPQNPVLTSDPDDPHALQKCGHGDLVETPQGEWYLAHLCSRPLEGRKWCTLGRETALQKVHWDEDGWLRLDGGGKYAALTADGPVDDRNACEAERKSGRTGRASEAEGDIEKECLSSGIREEFECTELPVFFSSPRISWESYADLNVRRGWLRLRGQESLNSQHHVSLLAVRQQEVYAQAETRMEFHPSYPEQMAGFTYFYDTMNFYLLGQTVTEDGANILTLLKSDRGEITECAEPVQVKEDAALILAAETSEDGSLVQFYWKYEDMEAYRPVGEPLSAEIVSDEHCRGFTGAHFGMFVHDMTGRGICADFDRFSVAYEFQPAEKKSGER